MASKTFIINNRVINSFAFKLKKGLSFTVKNICTKDSINVTKKDNIWYDGGELYRFILFPGNQGFKLDKFNTDTKQYEPIDSEYNIEYIDSKETAEICINNIDYMSHLETAFIVVDSETEKE